MNPFFQAMGGNRQPNMMQQFQQFMNQMKGKDQRHDTRDGILWTHFPRSA